MTGRPEWFAAKRYGYGAGLPISWQGWLVLVIYLAMVLGGLTLLGERNPASYAIAVIATAILLLVTARTTRGGWRWRWGNRDN